MINEHQQTIINNQEENQRLYTIDFPTINTIKQNSCQISQLSEEIGCQNKGCCDIELSTDIEFSCDLFNDNLKSLSKTQSIDFIQENNQEVFNRNDQNRDQIQEEEDEDYFEDEEEEEDEIEVDQNSQEEQYQQQNQIQQTQIQIENKQQQTQNSNVFQFNNEQIQKQIQQQQQQQLEQENGIFSSESETSSESSSEEEDAEEDDVSSEEIEEEDEDNYEDEFDQDTLRNTIRNAKKTYNQRDLNICLGQICDSLKNCEGFKQFIELNIDINIQSISEKCQNEIYKNQEEFKGDFEKMFEILYFNNTRNSSIYQETMKMQRKFIQLYSQFDAKYVQVQIQRLNQTSNFFIEQEEQKTNLPFNEGCENKNQNQNQNQKNQNNNQNTVSFDLAVKKAIQKPKRGLSLNVQKTKNNLNNNNKQKKVAGSKKQVIWSFAKIKQINYCVDECLQQGVVGHSFADLKQPHFYGPNQIQQQQEYFEEIEKQQSGFCSSNEFDGEEEDSEEDEEDTFDRFQKGGKINKKSYKQSQQLKSCLKKQLQMKNIRSGKKPYCNNMIVIKQGPLIESEFEDDELTTDQI